MISAMHARTRSPQVISYNRRENFQEVLGFSHLLGRVIKVQRGILISGDNGFYDEVAQVMGQQSEWTRLHRRAFGIESEDGQAPTLSEQVRAGLHLYILTAVLLAPVLRAEDSTLVTRTVDLVREVIG
jgi:hypothetical protein